MNCVNCQTPLPAQAVACWKCGAPVTVSIPSSPPRREADLLMALVTFVLTMVLFACVGWALPFTVWGTITSNAKNYPQWSGVLDIVSGASFFLTAIAFVAIVWRGSYWMMIKLTAKPNAR